MMMMWTLRRDDTAAPLLTVKFVVNGQGTVVVTHGTWAGRISGAATREDAAVLGLKRRGRKRPAIQNRVLDKSSPFNLELS